MKGRPGRGRESADGDLLPGLWGLRRRSSSRGRGPRGPPLPPAVARNVFSLRPSLSSPVEKSVLQPETGEAPQRMGETWPCGGGHRSASSHALTTPDTAVLRAGRGRGGGAGELESGGSAGEAGRTLLAAAGARREFALCPRALTLQEE